MDFIVHPLRGINDIEFGMTPELVRSKINSEYEAEMHRAANEKYPSDYFADFGFVCDYDEQGHLEAIEFFLAGRPFLGGVNMLTLPFGLASDLLMRLDPEVRIKPDMVTSRRLSLSIWSSEATEGDEVPVEAFLVGRPDYFDFLS